MMGKKYQLQICYFPIFMIFSVTFHALSCFFFVLFFFSSMVKTRVQEGFEFFFFFLNGENAKMGVGTQKQPKQHCSGFFGPKTMSFCSMNDQNASFQLVLKNKNKRQSKMVLFFLHKKTKLGLLCSSPDELKREEYLDSMPQIPAFCA